MKTIATIILLGAATAATAGEMKIVETDTGIVVEYSGTTTQKGGDPVTQKGGDPAQGPASTAAAPSQQEADAGAAVQAARASEGGAGAVEAGKDEGIFKAKEPQTTTVQSSGHFPTANGAQLRNRRQLMKKEIMEQKALRAEQQ